MFGHVNHLIFKVTRGCNLSCSYCYIKEKEKYNSESMSLEVAQKTIQRLVFDKKKNDDKSVVNITFHGGEPTKVGKKKIYQISEYIHDTLNREKIPFELSMQSNLTLIDEEFAQILQKFGVSLGFSFDGIDGNKLRTELYDDDFFIQKMKLFQKFNLNFGPLITITKENYDKIFETLDFLEEEFGIKNLRLNYAEDVISKKTSESDNFELDGTFFFENVWKKVIDDFLEDRVSQAYEVNVERIIRKFVQNQLTGEKDREKGNCGLKFCGGGIRIIEVEPDGRISYCGRYSKSFEASKVGFVWDKEFLDIQSYKRYFDFIKLKDKVIRETGCDTCPAKHICDHGCMAFYYSKYGKWGVRKDLVCNLYIPMHNYLYKNKEKLISKIIKNERHGDFMDLNLGKEIDLKEIGYGS